MVMQNGKTAIVVASAGGIGVVASQWLAADGFAVVLTFPGAQRDADACVSTIRACGGRAAAVDLDLGRPGAIRALFDRAEAVFGGIDVLVSEADITRCSRLADADEAASDSRPTAARNNVMGDMREAVRRLRAGGCIIGISSDAGAYRRPARDIFVATKAAIRALIRVFAAELRERSVALHALVLCSGRADVVDTTSPEATCEGTRRFEGIGDAVTFLAQSDSPPASGRILHVENTTVWPALSDET
jgi:3-oxoacyl-[acyl-carrier protein] reductase